MKQLNDLFVSYEIAKQLKDKGFNEPCLAHYDKTNFLFSSLETQGNLRILLPLYQQVVDWFREKHNIEIYCLNYYRGSKDPHYKNRKEYECRVNGTQLSIEGNSHSSVLLYNTYYEALDKAIEEAFKLI